jgi:hypothetical protein
MARPQRTLNEEKKKKRVSKALEQRVFARSATYHRLDTITPSNKRPDGASDYNRDKCLGRHGSSLDRCCQPLIDLCNQDRRDKYRDKGSMVDIGPV